MAKLIVKSPHTGETREMTEKSYELAGKKRKFVIVGYAKEPEQPKSELELAKDKLRAEKAAKEAEKDIPRETVDVPQEEIKPKSKPRPKPKITV